MSAHLAQLRLAGFKSFADPATLDILPGLTGLVGPNGCGKSNLAEALRWAMGEGHAGALRGGAMDDLIFAGTRTRPSRDAAEVALTLEGSFLPPFTSETRLQVVRRIGRSGGSAYQVNGRDVRARDVRALFADLGGGARASAMVGQSGVAAVIAARPDERRGLLEDAAGPCCRDRPPLLDRGRVAQLVSHRCPRFSPCRSKPTPIVATTFPASGIE